MRKKFTLKQAEKFAPLVRAILRDVTSTHAHLWHLRRRLDLLYECRRSERYDVRRQYYDTLAQAEKTEKKLDQLREELSDLGVVLLDPVRGVAGFPFRLVGKGARSKVRRAYFLLKLSDSDGQGLKAWQKAGETREHPIPLLWQDKHVSARPAETDTPCV
jgi:hypothetical protein